MFARWWVVGYAVLLAGCVDLGKVGMNPDMKQASFYGNSEDAYRCLNDKLTRNNLMLEEDEALSSGGRRFNLSQRDVVVAWLDLTQSGHETSADFFYEKGNDKLSAALSAAITRCQKELDRN
ncbi:hypothetical protein [Serratia ficaria]|uniref:hypothetical protein n=1 Tax=Serratia ficaria TaxID=61651 RepID=UPI000B11B42F|nr:hypothetical protein [Serratia ficaria]CAI1126347.1 Uncharacterised protein [Serratia ficaria]CAI1539427.1 Uncharacterised protein [Serratia ficaria]CAI1890312.1 Uncharacterised protein [Serratia ficaria]CAI2538428.1 Uncharacterised protein [Serratia ficaria]VVA49788.1 hypothetical protein SERVES_03547 [Serratia ficaria]